MGRIGQSPEELNIAVTTAANNVSSVSGVTVQELGKTTLARFKALIEMEKKIETTLTNYKTTYAVASTNKMKEVAQKIVEEDAQFGADFDKKTANLRFK